MSRYKYQSYAKDGNGSVITDAAVRVYLAGTTTAASVYTADSGGTAVNSVTSDSTGFYYFWVDIEDYTGENFFKTVISKTGFSTKTLDNIEVLPLLFAGSGTTANRPTVTTVGMYYVDTDLSAVVYWTGSAWNTNSLISDASPTLATHLDLAGYGLIYTGATRVSATEIGYLDGVSSNIQTQFNDLGTAAPLDSGTAAADLPTNAIVDAKFPGMAIRPKFTWKDADEIYLSAAAYHHAGTTEQMVYWDSQLTYAFASLANSDWSYLYIDNSAVVTAGTNLLTASELIDDTAEPTWSEAKHGWYVSNDRCIFAVRTDGSGNILEFWHDGDLVAYEAQIADLAATDIDTTWTDVTLTAPSFATGVQVTFKGQHITAAGGDVSWRKNGSSSTGHVIISLATACTRPMNTLQVYPDSDSIIEVVMENSTASTLALTTEGWYFPIGT